MTISIVKRILNDATLGFLALLSLFLIFLPSVFALSESGIAMVTTVEYLIIAVFATEYAIALVAADNKSEFVLGRWRIIDALIIIAAVIAAVPAVPDVFRNSTAFRILKLGRLALLGTRSSLGLTLKKDAAGTSAHGPTSLSVSALNRSGDGLEQISWDKGMTKLANTGADWLFIAGMTEDRLTEISTRLSVPVTALRGLFQSNVPKLDHLDRFTTLFVRYPIELGPGPEFRRTPVLLVASADNIVVLSREDTDLVQRVGRRLAMLDPALPPMARATAALLGEIVRAYTDVINHLENLLLDLEASQAIQKDESFIAQAFLLRTQTLRVRSSAKYLRSVMRDLKSGNLLTSGDDPVARHVFGLIADDVDDLYDAVDDLRESLQALVDLRLNVASFQMNRVMRLLALLTTLALIPATAGGLLGTNLTDAPWALSLSQLGFGVASGMALSLYIFIVKGWLR